MTRARREGNERRRATAKRADPVPKVIVPDTQERQAAAALARLHEADAQRPTVDGKPATVDNVAPLQRGGRFTIRKEATLPERLVPVRSRRSKQETAAEAEHEFDLDDALGKMNADYIQCRDFGHSWRPFTARWMQSENAYESQLKCTRCTTVRTRWLSRTGEQLTGQYNYADGYLVKGMGRLTGTDRDKVRLRSILAVIKP